MWSEIHLNVSIFWLWSFQVDKYTLYLLKPNSACFFSPSPSHPVLGLVPALVHTLRPTETILAGTIRTTEVASGATTEATGGPTTTAAETEAITNVVITRTGEEEAEAMAIRPIGRVVAAEEAGTIATMTRTTTLTAPGGGALVPAPAHRRSTRAAAAVPTTLTARLRADLDAPDAPATPLGPGRPPHAIAATRASLAPRIRRTS